MYVSSLEIPEMIPDNDFQYFRVLEGVLNSVDENCLIKVLKKPRSYLTKIYPSTKNHTELILKEMLKYHRFLNIDLDVSKSIKKSSVISYEIHL